MCLMCSAKHLGGYQAAEKACTIYNLQATILHLLGFNHERLTFRFQGRDFRLTDVEGQIVKGILA